MTAHRIAALIGKELREFRANPGVLVPVAIVILMCIGLPFLVVIGIPQIAGENLSSDRSLSQIVNLAAHTSSVRPVLSPEAAVQAFLFQHFLLLFLIAPIIGGVSLAAHSVVGEKQGRTLEPLLTTPLTTTELLVAKAVASFVPSMVIEALGLAVYFALVGMLALPGVAAALVTARTWVMVALVGPSAGLVALQAAIAISSRVNDPRSAQQLAVLLIVPIAALLVGQIAGAFVVTTSMLVVVALVLAVIWVVLLALSVRLFDRETILTRWR